MAGAAQAVVDVREFKSEQEEQRYHTLIEELRCPKCQNQNLNGSDSQIAADLRRELYRMINEGQSNGDIKTFMVDRYGDYILYRPRLSAGTFVLWFGPAILLLLGVVVLVWIVRRRAVGASAAAPAMSEQEQRDLKAMLAKTQ
ncbi:cytochrome c-type biogenesis protein CcmH [Halioxenophilus aromaticivorans]|uniref:Cytochrome c-type biogenesis protein n=2 Tax=Halioxenophilus aromaticivorans TaxID=1306992 RepID=A0AAV3TWB3_9ALTE